MTNPILIVQQVETPPVTLPALMGILPVVPAVIPAIPVAIPVIPVVALIPEIPAAQILAMDSKNPII